MAGDDWTDVEVEVGEEKPGVKPVAPVVEGAGEQAAEVQPAAEVAPAPVAVAPDGEEAEDDADPAAVERKPSRNQRLKMQRDRERQRSEELAAQLALQQEQLRQAAQYIARLTQHSQQREEQSVVAYERRIDEGIEMTKRALRQARETADVDGEVAATEQLTNLTWEKKQIGAYKANRPQPQQGQVAPQQRVQQPVQQLQEAPQPDPLAQEWAARNKAWFGGSTLQNKVMTQAALTIDYELQQEGYDPGDEAHYAEIDKRLGEMFPQTRRAGAPTLPVGGAPRGPVTAGKVRVSGDEQRIAQRLGVDVRDYAKEKARMATGEGEWTTIG